MHYLLWIDEKQQGPYGKRQILEMLLRGAITKQTLCCLEGTGDWNPVATIRGLWDELPPPTARTLKPRPLPAEQDHCFIVCHGERRGPYLPTQIRTMWKNGSITADSAVVWGDLTDPVPIARLLSKPVSAQSEASRGTGGTWALAGWGVLIFVGGIVGLIYYWQFFDTSVSVPTQTLFGETFGGGRVHNIGLMQKQQNGMIISGIAAALGFVCILLGQFAGKKQEM